MGILALPGSAARRMGWDDVPEILRIAAQPVTTAWLRPDFLGAFREKETIGWVVERGAKVVGFMICSVHYPMHARREQRGWLQALRDFCHCFSHGRLARPWLLRLVGLAVGPCAPQTETTQLLLQRLHEGFDLLGDRVLLPVPEGDLAAQQFLRAAGYRAYRVLEAFYPKQSAYLMGRAYADLVSGDRAGGAPPCQERRPWTKARIHV